MGVPQPEEPQGMGVHIYNPSTLGAKAGGLQVQSQTELQSKILSQQKRFQESIIVF